MIRARPLDLGMRDSSSLSEDAREEMGGDIPERYEREKEEYLEEEVAHLEPRNPPRRKET